MIEVLPRSRTARSRPTPGRRPRRALALMAALAWLGLGIGAAQAVQSVRVPVEADAIDLTNAVEHYGAQGDRIQVSTAPGADGIVRRIEVSALEAGAQPAWIVFALTNDSDEQLTRLVVAPHFRFVGSGVVWPDLGSSRITAITASQGSPPEREDRLDADVFRVTLDPGATVTYVAELRTPSLPQLYLWEPDAFKDKGASLTLYQGILIGVAGLLALFLTIVFVVRGALVFPAAAALAWSVFAYVCIDFGFWRKIFGFEDEAERVWRAGVEATIGATLIIFLFAYLNLRRWHVRFLHIGLVWLLLMAAVVGLSIYNAPVAAGVARISIATVTAIGFLLILSMAARGSDRAVMLIPTWFLLVVWVVAAGAAALGGLTNDIAAPGLIGGLVLIVMLIGFTIMQSAFANTGAAGPSGADAERRALAMTGCGDAIFDWNVPADQIYVSAEIESQLGLKRGSLEGPAASLARHPPSARSRPLFGGARRRAAAALGPHRPRYPAARRRQPLSQLHPQGAPGRQRRRRGGQGHRRPVRRHRDQDRRRAHPPRRDPRQPHRPAQSRIVPRPTGRGDRPGRAVRRADPGGAGDRRRPLQGGQRRARHGVRRFGAARGGAPARPRAQAGRHAGAHRRRPVRRHRHVRRHRRRARSASSLRSRG